MNFNDMNLKHYKPTMVTTWVYGGIFKIEKYSKLLSVILKVLESLGWIAKDGLSAKKVIYNEINLNREAIAVIYDIMKSYIYLTGQHPRKVIMGRAQQIEILKMENVAAGVVTIPLSASGVQEFFGMEIELNPLLDGVVVTR